jgi:hypothetical protein
MGEPTTNSLLYPHRHGLDSIAEMVVITASATATDD